MCSSIIDCDMQSFSDLMDEIVNHPCRDEILVTAFNEARSDPDKTDVQCLQEGLNEWDK